MQFPRTGCPLPLLLGGALMVNAAFQFFLKATSDGVEDLCVAEF